MFALPSCRRDVRRACKLHPRHSTQLWSAICCLKVQAFSAVLLITVSAIFIYLQLQCPGEDFNVQTVLQQRSEASWNALYKAIVASITTLEHSLPADSTGPLKLCPTVPPGLRGVMNVSSSPLGLGESAVEAVVGGLRPGGSWRPVDCTPRHTVALVIPYRDRWQQLLTLLYHLHPLLQRQQLQYRVFLVEQTGNDTFNKGVLMNAGFLTALRMLPEPGVFFHCFIFHDVDMLPEDDRNMYSCPDQPRHMSVAVNELNYTDGNQHRQMVGGVFAIRTDHFFKVNGYSNLYWGWGGEDNDMGHRVEQEGLVISRPPRQVARYTMMKHSKRSKMWWRARWTLVNSARWRYRLDGLTTAHFRLVDSTARSLYTHLLVDVGPPPPAFTRLEQHQGRDTSWTTIMKEGTPLKGDT